MEQEQVFPSQKRPATFACKNTEGTGDVALVNASDTKINWHTKVKGDTNPYDPA